jgi:leucyl aminopeptidase
MELRRTHASLMDHATACLVIGVQQVDSVEPTGTELDSEIQRLLDAGDFKPTSGATLVLHQTAQTAAERVLLVGLGKPEKFDAFTQTECYIALGKALNALPITEATLDADSLTGGDQGKLERVGYGLQWSAYTYTTTKGPTPDETEDQSKQLETIHLRGSEPQAAAVNRGLMIGRGANTTRELGNLPGNTCTPRYLADQAVQLAERYSTLTCEVFDEDTMAEIGMHCLLSVSQGSDEPARFIILNYQGTPDTTAKPKVLVGKGVTFDTGGISLKPGGAMDEMKFDMCGAATVMGCMQAIADMGLEANVIGVIAAAENMPSGRATKPGDVVTTLAGKTVEILNTDAEGRLVLCDALTYVERFEPEAVVDIATLTGACLVALGKHNTGLLSTDDALAEDLLRLGRETGDPCWRLPIEEPYQKLLDSNFADMANIGGRDAGTITAACFLARFTENKGASGRPVPLLVNWLAE